MSEITRVPLQPVAKGSLTRIWLGVAVAVALGAGVAYATRIPHFGALNVETVAKGDGASPTKADVALINYVGYLAATGKEFDRGEKVAMPLEGVIPGFADGLAKMQRGGKYKIEIPAAMGYGADEKRNQQTGEVVIPANSDLVFEVELLDFRSAAELEEQRRMLQQMQGQGMPGMPGQDMPGMPGGEMPHP